MEDEDIPKATISDWQPLTDKHLLAVLGKLGEETSELSKILFRTIIQGGLDEKDPETGKTNRKAIEEEIADVRALIDHAETRLGLDLSRLASRRKRKFHYKNPWFNSLFNQGLKR
jgi:hypothetical protein